MLDDHFKVLSFNTDLPKVRLPDLVFCVQQEECSLSFVSVKA